MRITLSFRSFLLIGLALVSLLACNSILPFGGGSSAATLAEVAVYPGATELVEGDSNIADTLAQNVEQNEAMKQAMSGLGNTIDQKGFQLPAETSWDQIKAFYGKELEAAGWSSGLGGIAGSFVDLNAMMEAANQGNDMAKTALWSKDKQTLTLVMITDPTDSSQKQLIFSLSSQ